MSIECAGWACGRGSAWVAFRAARTQKAITSFFAARPKPAPPAAEAGGAGAAGGSGLPKGVEKIDFTKNSTGFHTVELRFDASAGGFHLVAQKRFNLYGKPDQVAG